MSRDQFSEWTKRHLVQLVIAAVTAGVAWGVMQEQVRGKADRAEVQRLQSAVDRKADRDSVYEILREVRTSQRRVEKYLCAKSPNQLGC